MKPHSVAKTRCHIAPRTSKHMLPVLTFTRLSTSVIFIYVLFTTLLYLTKTYTLSESVCFLFANARSLDDIDDVVAKFLTLRNDIHIEHANLIVVQLVAHVDDVLFLQL